MNTEKNNQEELYTWYKLETSLNGFIKQRLISLPSWAEKKGYKDIEQLRQTYKDRLVFEFTVVKKMGFLGYFLIVADLIEYCRDNDISTGPGRGSAAGSLIAYLLKMTKVDPIKYDLLFERFLNPDRVSMPDFDLDISQAKRDQAKEYLAQKYGIDKVAGIGTFGRMKVRAAIKDVVRSLNLGGNPGESFKLADKISKTLEEEDPEIEYYQAIRSSEQFKKYMDQYPEVARHIEKCEDVLRQIGSHPAGVLISNKPLAEDLPLIIDKNNKTIASNDGKTLEKLGYLKLDTLGLKNLDIIADCRMNIESTRGFVPKMELDGIEILPNETSEQIQKRIDEIQDEGLKLASNAYKYLREQSTLGIFQCDQSVTQSILQRSRVNSIEDGADILSLIRPGPRKAGSTETYIRRKNQLEPYETWYVYEHESLEGQFKDLSKAEENLKLIEEILIGGDKKLEEVYNKITWPSGFKKDFLEIAPKLISFKAQIKAKINNQEIDMINVGVMSKVCDKTQGIPLFQEHLMQIAVRCASFSRGDSDVLRKAVGKKDIALINKIAKQFIDGLVKGGAELNSGGVDEETAQFIWYKFILPYGSYGFNASHSTAYFFISYETAWLKANFPAEFYASLLSHEDMSAKNQDFVNKIIQEAKNAGVSFLPPDTNKSTGTFAIVDEKTIVYSLTCMRGVGDKVTENIIKNRPYKNMVDFLGRSEANSRVTLALINGGAFDKAFDNEKISRKNYSDFYEDCVVKLKRQIDRLFRESLVKEFGYIPKSKKKDIEEDEKQPETVSKFHERMYESNQEYRNKYYQGTFEILKEFEYDWTGPLTINNKGVTQLVERASGDERDLWTEQETHELEEQVYGTVLSGHRLDLYKRDELNFIENANKNAITIHKLSIDLNRYNPNDIVYVFCQGIKLEKKIPYKNDPKKSMRLFEIEDRHSKTLITVFDQTFINCCKMKFNPLTIMARNSKIEKVEYRPVMILKLKINEYNGRRGLLLDSIVKWINEEQIQTEYKLAKQKELE